MSAPEVLSEIRNIGQLVERHPDMKELPPGFPEGQRYHRRMKPSTPSTEPRYPKLSAADKKVVLGAFKETMSDLKLAKSPTSSSTVRTSRQSSREVTRQITGKFAANIAAAGKAGKSID